MATREKMPDEPTHTLDDAETMLHNKGIMATTIEPKDEKLPSTGSSPNEEDASSVPSVSTSEETLSSSPTPPPSKISGNRLRLLVLALCVALSQSTLETTIVSTSLVSITDALGGFERRDWVVSAYLLTYTGFLVVLARVGTLFGTKATLLAAVAVFVVASALCGSATSLTALIVWRAFQGVGGAGIVANVMVAVADLAPRHKAAKYVAAVAAVNGLSSILGPVLGGVINVHDSDGQWRWVFLFNVPLGSVAFVMVAVLMPSATSAGDFAAVIRSLRAKFSRRSLARLDGVGAFLLLASTALLVFALEEGGTRYAWGSEAIVSTFTLAGVSLAAFVAWELRLECLPAKSSSSPQPVFPIGLLRDRALVGILLSSFFTGFPYVSLTVNIPQRAQAVDGSSPLIAGLSLLPMLIVSALFTPISAILLTKARVPPVAILFAAATLQLVGVALLCTLGTMITTETATTGPSASERAAQFGYEALIGAGIGANLTVLVMVAQAVAPPAGGARAVMLSAIPQVRVLAGTVGVAVCATLLNNHVASASLDDGGNDGNGGGKAQVDTALLLTDSLAGIDSLPAELQGRVRTAFAQGYRRQFVALAGLSAAVLLSTLLMCTKRLTRRPTEEELQGDTDDGDQAGESVERNVSPK